jgi:hypothetical protein
MIDIDRILAVMNARDVAYLVIGGMNFLLRHEPVLTFDVDLWIDDTPENRRQCEAALAELGAEWGPTEGDWQPVAQLPPGWTQRQGMFCLACPHGAVDVFRSVRGLESWAACRARAVAGRTSAGTPYLGLSDEDMLRCQLALPEAERKLDRIRALRRAIEERRNA